jgi:hypothetical protein
MSTHGELGDKLLGDKVRIVARDIDKPILSKSERSGTHKRMFTIARDSVECMVEFPKRWRTEQKPEPRKD